MLSKRQIDTIKYHRGPTAAERSEAIVIQRTGALGDVIDVTAIVKRLWEEDPNRWIFVRTGHPHVFRENLRIQAVNPGTLPEKIDRFYNLDGILESNRAQRAIDLYSREVFGDTLTNYELELFIDNSPHMTPHGLDQDHCIVIHPARTWPSRTLPKEFWRALIYTLGVRGWQVLIIGTEQDWWLYRPNEMPEHVWDARGQLDFHRQLYVIDRAPAFICSDTGMMAAAQATNACVIALLTISLPWMAERQRHGEIGWGFYPISAGVKCVGCTHLMPPNVTYFKCLHAGTSKEDMCTRSFLPDIVAQHAISKARWHREYGENARLTARSG